MSKPAALRVIRQRPLWMSMTQQHLQQCTSLHKGVLKHQSQYTSARKTWRRHTLQLARAEAPGGASRSVPVPTRQWQNLDMDPELAEVLDLASAEELEELHPILYSECLTVLGR